MSGFGSLKCRIRTLFDPNSDCDTMGNQATKLAMEFQGRDMESRGEEVKRWNYGPDGQQLPDYLSYSAYGTMQNGQWAETGTIVQVPQTYYGDWIPLSPGWVYGGESSPTASPDPAPVATPNNYAPQYAAEPDQSDPSDQGQPDDSQAQAAGDQGSDQDQSGDAAAPAPDGSGDGDGSGDDGTADAQPAAQAAPQADPNQDQNAAPQAPAQPPAANPTPANQQPDATAAVVQNPPASPASAIPPTLVATPATALPVTTTPPVTATPALTTAQTALASISGSLSGSASGSGSKKKSSTSTKLNTITYVPLDAKYLTSLPDSAYRSGPLTSASNSSACPSCTANALQDNDGGDKIQVVPAVVVPLLSIILIVGGVMAYLWRKKRNNQMISRSLVAGSGGFGGWLLGLVNPKARRRAQADRYTRLTAPSTPSSHRRSILKHNDYASPPGQPSPTEKSGLISGYQPNHHRSMSAHSYHNVPPSAQTGDGGLMHRLSGGFATFSPSRWSGGKNSPSPRRTSGHSVERGLSDEGPYGQYSDNNPYRGAMGSNGFGGASASPNGGYVSLDADDGDGPLVLWNTAPNGTPVSGGLQRSKSEYTPNRPSGLRYVETAEYGLPPPFHLSNPSMYMEDGEKKTLAQAVHAEGQDVGEISPAAYAARARSRGSGPMSPDSMSDERRSSVSPLLFPIAQPSNSGHSRTSHPKDQRKVFYDVNGRITSPPEYSAYADYSDLLSQYAHSSNGARTDPGAGSPSRSALSPASSYPASSENHGTGGIPNIMDLLANYGYDPNSTNPMAYTMAGPSRTPPALLEPMPMHHQRQRRGSALEERLLPASPMGARSPGSPRSPRRKGYAMHDGGSPSPKPRGKSRFGTSDVSHYSDERETIVSGTGDLADMIRSRSGPSPGRIGTARPHSADEPSVYTTPSEGHSIETATSQTMTETHQQYAQHAQRAQPQVIRQHTPLRVPGGWTDMPAPPRLPFGGPAHSGSQSDLQARQAGKEQGDGDVPASQSAGQFGSGWFGWITDGGGNTMSRGT